LGWQTGILPLEKHLCLFFTLIVLWMASGILTSDSNQWSPEEALDQNMHSLSDAFM
jgi:hypothetical protein